MREGIGGSILFYIILGFLAVYIVFIGVIINYASTYRTSNFIVTLIEQTEGEAALDTTALCSELNRRKYFNSLTIKCDNEVETPDGKAIPVDPVYTVITNMKFEIPLLSFPYDIDIKNETKAIYGMSCPSELLGDGITVNCGGSL